MIEKSVILPVSTSVQIRLIIDEKGLYSIGIRINGSNECLMAQSETLPKAGTFTPFTTCIGDIM